MRDKLVLRFLGFLETIKYILEQSHGVPPVSVALDHTTFKEEGSCGYSSVKTVRSIVSNLNGLRFYHAIRWNLAIASGKGLLLPGDNIIPNNLTMSFWCHRGFTSDD